jgi:hypothetical protein
MFSLLDGQAGVFMASLLGLSLIGWIGVVSRRTVSCRFLAQRTRDEADCVSCDLASGKHPASASLVEFKPTRQDACVPALHVPSCRRAAGRLLLSPNFWS